MPGERFLVAVTWPLARSAHSPYTLTRPDTVAQVPYLKLHELWRHHFRRRARRRLSRSLTRTRGGAGSQRVAITGIAGIAMI